jgi:hypothetical protein
MQLGYMKARFEDNLQIWESLWSRIDTLQQDTFVIKQVLSADE